MQRGAVGDAGTSAPPPEAVLAGYGRYTGIHSQLMAVLEGVASQSRVELVDFIPVVDQHREFFASYVHLTDARC